MSNFFISREEETLLSDNFQSIVQHVGEYVCGDEKLFRFTGNSGYIRMCPNKPDRIGLWTYELTAQVGKIHFRIQSPDSNPRTRLQPSCLMTIRSYFM